MKKTITWIEFPTTQVFTSTQYVPCHEHLSWFTVLVTRVYKRLHEITGDYKKLLEITRDYWRLQEITGDYKRLLEITRNYWRITRDYWTFF